MTEKHAAYFDISYEVLRMVLGLPEDTEIRRVVDLDDGRYWEMERFRVVVSHPDLPSVLEGQALQQVDPVFEERSDEPGIRLKAWNMSRRDPDEDRPIHTTEIKGQ